MTRKNLPSTPARALVVMGVAGCGKTTVGRTLADRLGWAFVDADDHHPDANVAKMRAGVPLTDADRRPWLARLRRVLEASTSTGDGVVLACSALKRAYRRTLARCESPDGCARDIAFAWLDAPTAVLERRLAHRSEHFAGPALLASQLRDLEIPEPHERPTALRIDAAASVGSIVDAIVDRFGLDPR